MEVFQHRPMALRFPSLCFAAKQVTDHAYREQHEKDKKQDFCKANSSTCNAAKTEDGSNYCYDEESKSPVQHDISPLIKSKPETQHDALCSKDDRKT
jgi:hypothetical protein